MELNKNFIDGIWSKEINVGDFVRLNITPYTGDASFLQGATERTKRIWELCLKALEEERNNNGVRALDSHTVSTITSHKAGYIDKENELIVGLQTDELLKRAIKPFGGINVVAKACHGVSIKGGKRKYSRAIGFCTEVVRRILHDCSNKLNKRHNFTILLAKLCLYFGIKLPR